MRRLTVLLFLLALPAAAWLIYRSAVVWPAPELCGRVQYRDGAPVSGFFVRALHHYGTGEARRSRESGPVFVPTGGEYVLPPPPGDEGGSWSGAEILCFFPFGGRTVFSDRLDLSPGPLQRTRVQVPTFVLSRGRVVGLWAAALEQAFRLADVEGSAAPDRARIRQQARELLAEHRGRVEALLELRLERLARPASEDGVPSAASPLPAGID